jgi:hypothetical protein
MQYLIKVEQGKVVGFPMLVSNLILVDENIQSIDKDFLEPSDVGEFGYGIFLPKESGDIEDPLREYVPAAPVEESPGVWTQNYIGSDIVFDTDEEYQDALANRHKHLMGKVREKRNRLLEETDWVGTNDAPENTLLLTYRQALRDLPSTVDINNPVFPEDPRGE